MKQFFHQWKAEAPVGEIAAQLQLSEKSVRRLFRRFEQFGAAGIANQYEQCGTSFDDSWKQRVAQVRQDHPGWGAEMIRLHLNRQQPNQALPSSRTMQRWLKQLELNPAPRGRRPFGTRPTRLPRAAKPHQAWQIDAAEDMKLNSGRCVSWLRVVDECSGAFLKTHVFSAKRWEHVDCFDIRRAVRKVFCQWGLPHRIQVDNGYPWGSTGLFPPAMALWLIGLGIDVIWSWPGCPQENGVVERSQGTGKRWSEPGQCNSAAELQHRLDEMDRLQRESYPYRGRTRLEIFPELSHSGRVYTCRDENKMWDLRRVLKYLSQHPVVAQVDRYGGVSIYHYSRFVGKQHAGKKVCIGLDPDGPAWILSSPEGQQWRTHAAKELTKKRILALNVGNRKGNRKAS